MYAQHFGLKHEPFSIAPDPRYLFMSERHREALAHLLYGVGGGGGFVLLTGEIGAGKTTVCRCFLEQIPRRCNVAYIFNPKLTVVELLRSICDEFRIPVAHVDARHATVKDYLDPLNEFLLKTHSVGQNNVLIIDEAQNLSPDVLEQLRLLTNLETSERKLLQIILIGQPELRAMLARPELEQLAQRVIARFHLSALSDKETRAYVQHRLAVAGARKTALFDRAALQRIHRWSRGVPRRINLLCDRALLGAYAQGKTTVDRRIVDHAAREVFDQAPASPETGAESPTPRQPSPAVRQALVVVSVAALAVGTVALWHRLKQPAARTVATTPLPPAAARPARTAPGVAALGSATNTAGTGALSAPITQVPPTWPTEADAWRDMATLWRVPPPSADPCRAGTLQQLQCFKGNNGLGLIRQLGRPGILTLRNGQGQPVYAVIVGLGHDRALLRQAGVIRAVPLRTLAPLWQGDFVTWWRTPPGYKRKIMAGDRGPAVDWLAARLSAIDGRPLPSGEAVFDQALQARVQAFQLAQGLKPDGVAGAVTLMLLRQATDQDEPRLQTER